MSDNNQNGGQPAKKKSNYRPFNRGGSRFNQFQRNTGPRERPLAIPIPGQSTSNSEFDLENANDVSIRVGSSETQSFELDTSSSLYPGWALYFPQEKFKVDSKIVQHIQAFEEHLLKYPLTYKLQKIRQQLWFPLSIQRLANDEKFVSKWPNFHEELVESPEETLFCAGLAAHQRILKDLPALSQSQLTQKSASLALMTIRARIEHHTPIINLRSLKENTYSRLISVRGTVIRANGAQLITSWMVFQCGLCRAQQALKQPNGIHTTPTSCKSRECRNRSNFKTILNSPFTRSEPSQILRLQESMQNAGELPKNIEVQLMHDLVDAAYPGDDVTVTGILKMRQEEGSAGSGFRNSATGRHRFYLSAVSVVNNKKSSVSQNTEFGERDLEVIQRIARESDPLKLLVHSLCPQIFGHEMVKAGLIMAMFGGSGNGPDGGDTPGFGNRSETHVLIVGDPGIGKSHMLQACANVSPRGIFVCGNSTSNAGLTVSVRHEKGTGSCLEAGALVLADQGVCCIDEFDKMAANHQSLLQVMEQQTVSVAKAGVLCALPARTCILAAANPVRGHYDKSRTVSENLKINPALLSRFDLVFILLDQADARLDDLLTAHVQALHDNNRTNDRGARPAFTQSVRSATSSFTMTGRPVPSDANTSLYERLTLRPGEKIEPLPHETIQQYIGYARQQCFPALSPEAAQELKAFYLEMRKTSNVIDSIPVTTRQLEALIRLTQARARVDLVAIATVQHARDVLAILRFSMCDVLSTDKGTLQMSRKANGAGMSQATQSRKFLQTLQTKCKAIFTFDELKEIAQTVGFEQNLSSIIDSLNIQGFLIKKGNGIYKFIC